MDTREISDMRVSAEFLINGNSVKERPLPDLDTPQLQGHPRGPLQDQAAVPRVHYPLQCLGCCRLKDCGPTSRCGC